MKLKKILINQNLKRLRLFPYNMKFSSKVRTLINLKKKVKFSKIPNLIRFKVIDYKKNPEKIIKSICKKFSNKVAVRSSSCKEDNSNFSNAGKYKSNLNVDVKDKTILNKKILEVIKSLSNKNDEFFIQEMATKIKISGVVTTYSLSNLIKSYNINYHSGMDTSNVTSGLGNNFNFFYLENEKYKIKNKIFEKVISSVKELERVFNHDKLDVEFAVDKNNNFFLLQVRRLIFKQKLNDNKNVVSKLNYLGKKVKKIQTNKPNLNGKTTFFGVMTDWNPAEMIGIKPKPLALSLYKYLITDYVWAKSRASYGYKNVEPYQLMTSFFGTPFIDIRTDFNSFLPNNLDYNLQQKLTNFYLNKFKKNKFLHDKIEFEIIFSSFSFNLKSRLDDELPKHIFNKEEKNKIYNELKVLTFKALRILKNEDYKKIKFLDKINKSNSFKNMHEIDKIFWLTNLCRDYGTLPFSGLARCAFMATELLNSFVDKRIFTIEDKENFIKSINLITSKIINDKIKLSKKNFLKEYGHMRPDMYEITNLNYNEGFYNYFRQKNRNKIKINKFNLNKIQKLKIDNLLKKEKLKINTNQLIEIISKSIYAREYSKFVFSKTIDLVFQNIKKLFKRIKINHKYASFISINRILLMHNNLENNNLKKIFLNEIKNNQSQYKLNNDIKLPSVILSSKDLFSHTEFNKINFVTSKKLSANLVKISNQKKINLKNKIALIENADPGYDYIFDQKISGLITLYGGINSHMSLRCSELGIPAAIGIGENLYNKIMYRKMITIDCQTKRII